MSIMTVTNEKEISNRGFSLVELIIVIAIMAVLVGILTPQYLSYMHRAKVAADWANLKNYYTEITLDYITTGQYNSDVKTWHEDNVINQKEIHFLNGQTAKLKAGAFTVVRESTKNGYQILYECDEYWAGNSEHQDSCELILR